MNSGKIVLGVLGGLAAGALLGILLAPEKGSVTRKNIMNKGEDYLDGLKGKFDELMAAITDKFESVKDELKDVAADEQAGNKAGKQL